MNKERDEAFYDLLIKKAVYGLDEAEQKELNDLDADAELTSLELTAAAIGSIDLKTDEPMPAHLRTKIARDAQQYLPSPVADTSAPWPPAENKSRSGYEDTAPIASSWFGWLGWAAAAAACIALLAILFIPRTQMPTETARTQPPPETPRPLSPAQLYDQMIQSTGAMVKASWGPGNVGDMKAVSGDVVWSPEKQMGFVKLKGLKPNDPSKETYQLWIVDKTRDEKYAIDGGTFDVTADGEMIVPINAKLKAMAPEMFAITMEKPGGVVVSKMGKVAAVAKVETKTGPAA